MGNKDRLMREGDEGKSLDSRLKFCWKRMSQVFPEQRPDTM